jgi:hypothetical protein
MESKSVLTASVSKLPAIYDDFLYAPIGEDTHGTLLTVLSVIARRNVDPWAEAAHLNDLPRDSAASRLTSMIAALPDRAAGAELPALANRLIGLLPGPARPRVSAGHQAPTVNFVLIAIYVCVMLMSQWLIGSAFEQVPSDVASAASLPSQTNPPPSRTSLSQTGP